MTDVKVLHVLKLYFVANDFFQIHLFFNAFILHVNEGVFICTKYLLKE